MRHSECEGEREHDFIYVYTTFSLKLAKSDLNLNINSKSSFEPGPGTVGHRSSIIPLVVGQGVTWKCQVIDLMNNMLYRLRQSCAGLDTRQ